MGKDSCSPSAEIRHQSVTTFLKETTLLINNYKISILHKHIWPATTDFTFLMTAQAQIMKLPLPCLTPYCKVLLLMCGFYFTGYSVGLCVNIPLLSRLSRRTLFQNSFNLFVVSPPAEDLWVILIQGL